MHDVFHEVFSSFLVYHFLPVYFGSCSQPQPYSVKATHEIYGAFSNLQRGQCLNCASWKATVLRWKVLALKNKLCLVIMGTRKTVFSLSKWSVTYLANLFPEILIMFLMINYRTFKVIFPHRYQKDKGGLPKHNY